MPAERRTGPILGDERVSESLGWHAQPCCDFGAQRVKCWRQLRSSLEDISGEIVAAAEARDATARLELLVLCWVKRKSFDDSYEGSLFFKAQKIGLVSEAGRPWSVGWSEQRGQIGCRLHKEN